MHRTARLLISTGWLLTAFAACSAGPDATSVDHGGRVASGNAGGGANSTANGGASTTSATVTNAAASSDSGSLGGSTGSGSLSASLSASSVTSTSGGLTTGMAGSTGSTTSGASSTGIGAGGTGTGGQGGAAATSAGDGSATGGTDGTSPVDQATLPDVTLHLAGDSTVMTYEAGSAQEGWGQELGQFFIDKVSIDNQAIGGASVRTFQTGRWKNIQSTLTAGDYVMIQFGTNDSGTVAGRHVDVPDFSVALGEMIDDVEERQATALLVTPSALQEWSGGMEGNSRLGPYADAMRELGPMRHVLVDDLNARSVEYLNMIGQTAAEQTYIDGDKAHFTKMGAIQMAEFVAEELQRIGSPLADYLRR